jgi:hypothetical protein
MTVLTFISEISPALIGIGSQLFIHMFSFYGRKVIDVAVVQCTGHAILDTLRIAVAKIAFGGHFSIFFKMNGAERTCGHAHLATHAGGFINDHGVGSRVSDEPFGGADFQAKRGFTLQACHRKNGALFQIDLYPYI